MSGSRSGTGSGTTARIGAPIGTQTQSDSGTRTQRGVSSRSGIGRHIGSSTRTREAPAAAEAEEPVASSTRQVGSTRGSSGGGSLRSRRSPAGRAETDEAEDSPRGLTAESSARVSGSSSRGHLPRQIAARQKLAATQDRIRANVDDAKDRIAENQQMIREKIWATQDRARDNLDRVRENAWAAQDRARENIYAAQDRIRSNMVDNARVAKRIRELQYGHGGIYRPVRYHERPRPIGAVHYPHHVWLDHRRHLHTSIIWPGFSFSVLYNRGPRFTFGHCYPYYHRKYVFVSLGGYWPAHYGYTRYYWYGYHPYDWCGYAPIAREVAGDTHNYYTYNYYGQDDGASYSYSQAGDGAAPVDPQAYADVREKLAQQAAEGPSEPTLADKYFENAVKAFEAADYDKAVQEFARAKNLAPADMVLPFAYSQALFANGQYSQAAEVLRAALAKVTPAEEGVFYPRGLYADDKAILKQIEVLIEKADSYTFDADLQLLLGYQLLGIGELDAAGGPLLRASMDLENAKAAQVLLNLLKKIDRERSKAEEEAKAAGAGQTAGVEAADPVSDQPTGTNQDTGTEAELVPLEVPGQSKAIREHRPIITVRGTVFAAAVGAVVGGTRIRHRARG